MATASFNLDKRQRQWKRFYGYEKRHKGYFLRRLSEKKSINILRQLYAFSNSFKNNGGFGTLGRDRVKALSQIHFFFEKLNK